MQITIKSVLLSVPSSRCLKTLPALSHHVSVACRHDGTVTHGVLTSSCSIVLSLFRPTVLPGVWGKGASTFFLTLPNADRFSKIFSLNDLPGICSKVNTPLHLKYVATLPCEMFVLKNHYAPKLSEITVSHSVQMLRNICVVILASFGSLTKRYLWHWQHEKSM